MREDIYKKDGKIIIEIPFWQDALDYFGEKVGQIHNIIGVIEYEKGEEKCGIHQLIDMTYADKQPQIDGLLYCFDGEKEEFIKLCQGLEIEVFEYPVCSKCCQTICGSFTSNKKYDKLCFTCEQEEK